MNEHLRKRRKNSIKQIYVREEGLERNIYFSHNISSIFHENVMLRCNVSHAHLSLSGVGVALLLTSIGGALKSDDFHDEGREVTGRVATAQGGHVRQTVHVSAALLFRSVPFYFISRGQEGLRRAN